MCDTSARERMPVRSASLGKLDDAGSVPGFEGCVRIAVPSWSNLAGIDDPLLPQEGGVCAGWAVSGQNRGVRRNAYPREERGSLLRG